MCKHKEQICNAEDKTVRCRDCGKIMREHLFYVDEQETYLLSGQGVKKAYARKGQVARQRLYDKI